MLNPNLTSNVIASLKAAGITPPELSPIRPFPKSRATIEDLTEILISSDYEDPYEDPQATAIVSKLYIQSMGQLEHGHNQRERTRQAAGLEAHKDDLFKQIQAAFTKTSKKLIKDAEPLKRVEDLSSIDTGTARHDTAISVVNILQGISELEGVIKAWRDLWAALGNRSYGNERGLPFTFMNPNPQQWEQIRRNPTIWEGVRTGVTLTLADRPEEVSARWQALLIDEQPKERERQSLLPPGGYPQFRTLNI